MMGFLRTALQFHPILRLGVTMIGHTSYGVMEFSTDTVGKYWDLILSHNKSF